MYVVDLVADHTVNTMPEPTLQAVHDHGVLTGDSVRGHYVDAKAVLDQLAALGVSYDEVVDTLETEGLDKFEQSWAELIEAVQAKLDEHAEETSS
jgi:transaldolase